jgi:hypothetical protein
MSDHLYLELPDDLSAITLPAWAEQRLRDLRGRRLRGDGLTRDQAAELEDLRRLEDMLGRLKAAA